MTEILYESPGPVPAVEDCFFYHCLDLPGHGEILGQWDLRPAVGEYLGGIDLDGRRVLEIGPASGYLTFHMEQAGAEVVGCELASGADWDLVPYAGDAGRDSYVESRRMLQRKLQEGFWFGHRAFGSKAGVCYSSIYSLPETVGRFDVGVFGMVLLHVRDPFQAMARVLRQVDETAVVTEMFPSAHLSPDLWGDFSSRPCTDASDAGRVELTEPQKEHVAALSSRMYFCPQAALQEPKETWWHFTPSWIAEALKILGFDIESVSYHYQFHNPAHQWTKTPGAHAHLHPTFTIVGRRVRPAAL